MLMPSFWGRHRYSFYAWQMSSKTSIINFTLKVKSFFKEDKYLKLNDNASQSSAFSTGQQWHI